MSHQMVQCPPPECLLSTANKKWNLGLVNQISKLIPHLPLEGSLFAPQKVACTWVAVRNDIRSIRDVPKDHLELSIDSLEDINDPLPKHS